MRRTNDSPIDTAARLASRPRNGRRVENRLSQLAKPLSNVALKLVLHGERVAFWKTGIERSRAVGVVL